MTAHSFIDERYVLYRLRIGQSRQITGLLAESLCLYDTPHDLARPCLGYVLDEEDPVRVCYRSQDLANMSGDVFLQVLALRDTFLEYDEGDDLLALDLIGFAYDCGLCDLRVGYRC